MSAHPSSSRVSLTFDSFPSRARRGEVGEGRTPVNRPPSKSFRCEVVSETVTIALRRRTVFGGKGELFIRCSESDCQYVDANKPPCPLTLDLFADEVRQREAPRLEGR